jgi:methylenetetrahydrofolate reductase (NADPH)
VHISIELVPRDENSLHQDIAAIQTSLSQVNMINIPDLVRMKVRSWHGSKLVKPHYSRVVPHLRAVDFDLHRPLPFAPECDEAGITSVLVVTGDTPKTELRPVYPNSSIDLIKKIRREHPTWDVYAAIDPYRHSFQSEYHYAMEKIEAGVKGFFTQPFFDLRLMDVYADLLPEAEIYWGVSPVLTQRSQDYWETTNRAIFPRQFAPTLIWNRQFAQDALTFARERNQHIYYMPIRVDLVEYLGGIL